MKNSYWKGKNVLFIGDSMTARSRYPKYIENTLGINAFYHCKDGAHIVAMVDGENGLDGTYNDENNQLSPLTTDLVRNMDLIVLFGGYNNLLYGGYNNRSCSIGEVGDIFRPDGTGQDTIAGIMQYAIDRIYEELDKACNLRCKLLIVTVSCTGKNEWLNSDGNTDFPLDSGKSLRKIASMQKKIAQANSLPYCDLFNTSGINHYTWSIFCAEAQPYNTHYSPYLLDEHGSIIKNECIRYSRGKYYYQKRDGKIVLELYDRYEPYPYNRDQVHLSVAGSERIAEVIAGAIISAYGN